MFPPACTVFFGYVTCLFGALGLLLYAMQYLFGQDPPLPPRRRRSQSPRPVHRPRTRSQSSSSSSSSSSDAKESPPLRRSDACNRQGCSRCRHAHAPIAQCDTT